MLRMLTYLLLICAALSAYQCQSTEFTQLIDEYWNWRLEDAPEFASLINVHTYDARVEQYSIHVLDERKEKVDGFISRLNNINFTTLNPSERNSFDVLRDTLQVYSDGYKWRYYGPMNPVNFLEGLWTDPASMAPSNPKTHDDFLNYIERIFGWSQQALNFIKRMRKSIEEETTDHWVSLAGSLSQLDFLIGSSPIESPLYKPLNETLDSTDLPEANKTYLRQTAVTTLAAFRDYYKTLKEFVEGEFKNNTRTAYGVNSFKDGEDYYKACLKWHLSVDTSPEEVHQIGLKEVDRIYKEMTRVMGELNFTGSVKEFFDMLRNDSRFFINTPEKTIERFEQIINDRIKPKLSKYFKNIPDMPVRVVAMPFDGPGGSYLAGSPDGSRPGVFYVNVIRPTDNPTYDMVALSLHEADPGHHLQDIFAQATPGLPDFRKVVDDTKYYSPPLHFPFYTAYVEGWALYSEALGEKDELDIYADNYELMGRYSSEIFRACRLVVDTGLHHYNWTRHQAIEYMLNYTSYSRPALTIEIDRYITWPGQACAYKIGELKIRELRNRAEAALGPSFDIRDFHSVVVDNGAVPLAVLENLVDDWIAKQDSLDKIMTDYFAWRLKISPEFATAATSYKYNDKLESYSYDTVTTRLVNATGFLNRLNTIDRTNLITEKQVSYDILKNVLETYIAGYKWRNYEPLNPFNFLEGWQVGLSRFTSNIPLDTQGDFLNYIRRIELAPAQLDEMINISRMAIANGHTSNNVSVTRVPGQIDIILKEIDPEKSELYKPFTDKGAALFGNLTFRSVLENKLKTAIHAFNNKLSDVKKFIKDIYMPKTRPGLGVGSLDNGTDNYKACLKWHTSIDISPEQVHSKGKSEVERISKLMKEAINRLGFPGDWSISEVYANMTNDPKFLLPDGAATLERFREIIFQRIRPQISKYFSHVPDLPLLVQGSVSDGIGGEYMAGTADGSRPGIFYANVHRPEDNPTYKMVSLSLHEAIPGHHLADSYNLVSDTPDFRKYYEWKSYNVPAFFPFFNAYVEGWALYAEYLGEEMGIYHDDYELMGRYSDEMLRACRLVIDTGIHYFNWSRNDAIEYMLNYTAESRPAAAIEIDRYSTWPGQACGYKIGEMKIKELRAKAETELGNAFDIRDFHYTVLRNGPMPLDVLENVIDEWIASKISPDSEKEVNNCPSQTSKSSEVAVSRILLVITVLIKIGH